MFSPDFCDKPISKTHLHILYIEIYMVSFKLYIYCYKTLAAKAPAFQQAGALLNLSLHLSSYTVLEHCFLVYRI